MPSWKKVVTSGSNALLNQITASAGISTSGDIDLSGGKLWVGGTNNRVILGPKSDNYEGNRIDIGAGIRLFASGDQHFKGQGVTTTVGRDVNNGVVSLPRSLEVTENITATGNISGSSTSTGSFGRIQATTIGGNSPLTIEADNFSVDASGTVSGSGASTGSFGRLRVGKAVFGGSINVNGVVDTTFVKASNNIETTGGNISGSSTSTGSFARGFIADRLEVGVNGNEALTHKILVGGTIGGGTFSGTYINPTGGNLILSANNDVQSQKSIIPGYDYTTVNGRDLGSTSYRWKDIHFGGNISGSATSTGSFGAGYIDNKLGIGTSSPTQPLDVYGHVNIANTSGDVQFFFNTSNQSIILGSKTFIRNLSNNFEYGNTSGLQSHKFFTDGTQRVIIDNSGNVGIGTTSPDSKLHVDGDIRATGDIIAENFIVSSSVTYMTQSFSSGSTIFGDTQDDTHQFTGSLSVTGSAKITAIDNATLHVASSATNNDAYVRITEGSSYFGGFIKYAGMSNILELGVHNAGDTNVNNDTTAIQILRENNVGDVIFPIANQKISGSSTSTGSFGALSIGDSDPTAGYGNIAHIEGKAQIDRVWVGDTHTGGTNWASLNTSADDLVVDGGAASGISILSTATGKGTLNFSNYNDGDYSWIRFDADKAHTTFKVAGTEDVLQLTTTKISGSATSTGSFGHLMTFDSGNGAGGDTLSQVHSSYQKRNNHARFYPMIMRDLISGTGFIPIELTQTYGSGVFHVIHGEIEIMVSQVLNPLRIHFKAVHSAGNWYRTNVDVISNDGDDSIIPIYFANKDDKGYMLIGNAEFSRWSNGTIFIDYLAQTNYDSSFDEMLSVDFSSTVQTNFSDYTINKTHDENYYPTLGRRTAGTTSTGWHSIGKFTGVQDMGYAKVRISRGSVATAIFEVDGAYNRFNGKLLATSGYTTFNSYFTGFRVQDSGSAAYLQVNVVGNQSGNADVQLLETNGSFKLLPFEPTGSAGGGATRLEVPLSRHEPYTIVNQDLTLQGGDYADGNVSGSASSTGSFGSLVVADAIQGDTTLKGGDLYFDSFKGPRTNSEYLDITSTRGFRFNDHGAGVKFQVDGTHNIIYLGTNSLNMTTRVYGDLRLDYGDFDITGSATSTASFGTFIGDGSQLTGLSSGISNVVEDTSPQLGGDLDLNGNDITGTGNISITGGLTLAGSGPNINGAGGSVYMIPTNFIVRSNIINDSGDVKVNDNLTVTGNVSGSSTSTGSFGRGVIADTLRINKVNASATPLMIGAPSANMAVFHISNHLGNEMFRVDASSDGDAALTMRDSGQNADIYLHTATHTYFNNNGNFGIGTTSPGAKLTVHGDISGSATSTGSFGRLRVPDFINIGSKAERTGGTTQAKLWISGSSGVEMIMDNASGTANRRRVKMGFISNVWSLKTVNDGGAESTQHFGVNTYNSAVTFAGAVSGITNLTTTGNITAGGNVSGSSTSTGSFGAIFNPGVHPNQTKLTFPNSTAHFESGYNSGYTAFHGTQITLANSLGNASGYLYANHSAANDYGIQLGAYSGAVGGIQLTAENGAHLYAHMTGSVFEFGSPVTSISGSSTSTGSFGSLVVADKVQGDLEIKGNLFINDGGLDLDSGQLITGQKTVNGGTAFTFLKMYDPGDASIQLGSKHSLGYISFQAGNGSFTERMRIKNNGDIAIFNSHLSGSSSSTGSFGAGFFDDSVGMGVAPGNSSYMLNIEAAQTYAARFKSRKTSSSSAQRTMIQVGSGQTLGAGIFFDGPSSAHFSIGVKSDNKFHIAPGLNDIGDASSNSLTVDSSGNVEVNGDLSLDGTITEASTMRIKTNIETLESPLDKITKLRGVSYNLKENKQPSIGMIAEEVEQIFPELVSKDEDGKAAAMSYGRMTAVLLEAIKELKQEVDELRQENIYIKDMNRKNK